MSMSLDEVINAALALPDDERAILAERLLESLAPEEASEINDAWREEIEKRRESLRRGDAITVDGYELLKRLRQKYSAEEGRRTLDDLQERWKDRKFSDSTELLREDRER